MDEHFPQILVNEEKATTTTACSLVTGRDLIAQAKIGWEGRGWRGKGLEAAVSFASANCFC